jgi:23S rRNA (uracil1939-C5)-methyltransferase
LRVRIEKLIYGGDGLARLESDAEGRRKALFVPFTIAGEEADVRITEEHASFARGVVEQIASPSPHRVTPRCPYFFQCGGCQYQHIDYAHQLSAKAEILQETVARIAKVEIPGDVELHAAEPWNYRNRTRLHVQTAPEFAIGYHRANSKQLLSVETCPISSPLINRALSALRRAGSVIPHGVREIQLFANHKDSRILLEVYVTPGTAELGSAWEFLRTSLPEVVGLVVFPATRDAEDSERAPLAITASKVLQTFGSRQIQYTITEHDYRISGGSFFQTNRFLIDQLVHLVTSGRNGRAALDLYCGAGLFTVPLAQTFDKVIAVEASPQSFRDLKQNASPNVTAVRKRVDIFLQESGTLDADYVVADPPRAGLGEKVSKALGRMNTSRVTYVSCEPSTLSRDLRILLQSGFRIQKAHLVDLFPQTFHMESVFELVR